VIAGDILIRPYQSDDEAAVLELLSASLGSGPAGSRPATFFRWKHLTNPFGTSLMLIAEHAETIVGLRAFMRWRFTFDGGEIAAVRAVDTATHPDYQGKGIFRRLTLAALDELRSDTDLVFNTPNDKSLPGYLKMGWSRAGRIPIRVRIRRPIHFMRRVRTYRRIPDDDVTVEVDAPTAKEVLARSGRLRVMGYRDREADVVQTIRSPDYLDWRYGAPPLLGYRAICEDDAIAIFRVRPRGGLREATVAELLVPNDAVGIGARLLRAIGRSANVDHVTCSFPPRSVAARAARRAAFAPAPDGPTLVVNSLRPLPSLDATDLRRWALSLGDVEVF
jgi:GNAT superfamily N-acetyltransferase